MKDIPFTVELDPQQRERLPEARAEGRGAPGEAGGEPPVLTVTQLTRRIRGLLEEAFPVLAVEGELSNVKRAASGHVYFNLKDEQTQVRCVMFRGAAAGLRFEPEDGLQVILRGRVSVYEARGEYQLQVLTLEPRGTGALQLAFEQLKRRLEAEGLFDPAHKQPLPFLPRRIGVVTSSRGAAIRDIVHVLERRFPGLPVLLCPATVQGEQAAGEIAAGIATLNALAAAQRIDVLIVGRGGGSVEDLWAFNEEAVARAIFASEVPVISAVGHETDFTIADFVADVRAPTPSAAAELAVPNRADLLLTVSGLRERLVTRVEQELDLRRERREGLRARLGSPEATLRQTMQRVDDLSERIALAGRSGVARRGDRAVQARERLLLLRPDRFHPLQRGQVRELERRLRPALTRHVGSLRERVGAQMELLESLSPLTVLGRGYGVVRRPDGALVRSVGEVSAGERVDVRLRDGALETEVQGVHPEPDPPLPPRPDPPGTGAAPRSPRGRKGVSRRRGTGGGRRR